MRDRPRARNRRDARRSRDDARAMKITSYCFALLPLALLFVLLHGSSAAPPSSTDAIVVLAGGVDNSWNAARDGRRARRLLRRTAELYAEQQERGRRAEHRLQRWRHDAQAKVGRSVWLRDSGGGVDGAATLHANGRGDRPMCTLKAIATTRSAMPTFCA